MCNYILDRFIGSFKDGIAEFIKCGLRWPYSLQRNAFTSIPAWDGFQGQIPGNIYDALDVQAQTVDSSYLRSPAEWIAFMEMVSCDFMVYLEQSPIIYSGGTPAQREQLLSDYREHLFQQLTTSTALLH